MLTKMSLGEIVEKIPAATLLFRKYQLDFCFSGRKTLTEACRLQNLDLQQIVNELSPLEQVTLGNIWKESSSEKIIDHIENYFHKKHRLMLQELISLAVKVESNHKNHPECPIGLAEFLSTFYKELDEHMVREETLIFPLMKKESEKKLEIPFSAIEAEVEEHGYNLNMLRVLAFSYLPPAGSCGCWKALYRGLNQLDNELMDHVHLEIHVLFKRFLKI